MKKLFVSTVLLFVSTTFYVQAQVKSCADIGVNLIRGSESSSVLTLQMFLYQKGYLKASPNGYFGAGTVSAVKLYQKSVGISPTGSVYALTRARIKKDSCGVTTSQAVQTSPISKPVTSAVTTSVAKPLVTQPASVVSLTRNDQRRKDINAILQALASRFRNTRVHALPVNETPIELCVTPILKTSTTTASNGSLLLVTEESPCKEYIDIAYLSPSYLSTIPRDPTLATSSAQIGYMITRSESNDITITPKTLDDKAVIKVTCNFNAGCSSVEQISTTIYTQPYIISIDRPIFLRDATPKTSITIVGKGFTGKNAVTLTQRNNSKEYYLGEFISTNGTTTLLDPNSLNKKFPCGDGCTDGVPVGDYMVTIKNEGGVSNVGYISIKSYTTSTISSHGNSTVTPNSSSTKIGSITVSSDISLTLKSLTLTSTTTNKLLPLKITKLVLKDSQVNTAITSSGSTFTLPSIPLGANESKIFDIYADIGDVFIQEFGRMSYSGTILARDSLSGVDLEFSIKEFLFTVSY